MKGDAAGGMAHATCSGPACPLSSAAEGALPPAATRFAVGAFATLFAIGRNHPALCEALKSVLDADMPNLVQFDVSTLAGILAERLLEYVPYLDKVFFANSGAETVEAAWEYFEKTGRRVSIEYAMMRGINDQAWRADLLGKKLAARGRGWVHVNPIPLNPTPGSKWTASRPGVEQQFVERLRAHGIPTTVRDTRGSDIDGACGQLAAASG